MQFNISEARFGQTELHRQPRFGYGPLLGLLFANILSNSAVARYPPLGALRLAYDPIPSLSQNIPSGNQYHQDYWYPIKNTYGPPSVSAGTEAQHIHHHHHINPFPNQQQIVNINESPPTEVIIDEDNDDMASDKEREIGGDDVLYGNIVAATKPDNENPNFVEPTAQESIQVTITPITGDTATLTPKYLVKRGAPRRYASIHRKGSAQQKHRFTTADYYYDSYEDTTKFKVNKKSQPRRPLDSFEDSDEYEYDSFEFTTRPYRKRRTTTVRPKKNRNKTKTRRKQQKVTTLVYDDDYDYERVEPVTQIVVLRAREPQTTTEETMVTNGTTTTSATTTTTEAVSTTTNSTNAKGYGYGPSRGNENISFTYGPPQGDPQVSYGPPGPSYGPPSLYGPPSNEKYPIPYPDWFGHHGTKNSIVRKVNDFIGFEPIF